jgi:hypothetical protein
LSPKGHAPIGPRGTIRQSTSIKGPKTRRNYHLLPNPPPSPPVELDANRLRVYELLAGRVSASDAWVAECYLSGHILLTLGTVPDIASAAAHQFRELLDNLFRIIPDFPREGEKGTTNVTDAARNTLLPTWQAQMCARDDPTRLDLGQLDALPHAQLEQLMMAIHRFLQRVRLEQPVAAKLEKTLDLADPSGIAIPTSLRESRRQEWRSLRKSFITACHGHQTTREGVQQLAAQLDRLLMRTLVPAGAVAIEDLDDLIAGVEGGSA